MSRSLTEREIKYLNKLIYRNQDSVNFDPLVTPLSSNEEVMRLRLRRKAYRMLLDLFKLDKAGIINYGDFDDSIVKNILLLMNDAYLNEDQRREKQILLFS
jgi:hypothetical protein